MNENTITIRLCDEDRARLDAIIEKLGTLGTRPDCSQCVKDVAQTIDLANAAIDEKDEVQKKLAEVIARTEAAKTAQDEPKAADHPTLDPFAETPTAEAEASEKAVSTAELQQLVLALCRAGKKAQVREVVNLYGVPTVAAIPESKRSDAYAKLKQLEG